VPVFAEIEQEPVFAELPQSEFADIPDTLFADIVGFTEEVFLGAGTGIRQIGGGLTAVPFLAGEVTGVESLKEPFRSFKDSAKFVTPDDPGLTFAVSANIFNNLTSMFLFKQNAINALGLNAALTAMANNLENGHSLIRSVIHGAAVGGAEIYTEIAGGQIPALLAKNPGAKRVVMSTVKDTGFEMLNWLWQRGVLDPAILKEEFPSFNEVFDGLSETGIVNLISAGIMGSSKLASDFINKDPQEMIDAVAKAQEGLNEVDKLIDEKIKPKDFGKITQDPLAEAKPEDVESRIALGKALFPEQRKIEITDSKELKKIARSTEKLHRQQQLIQNQKHFEARQLGTDFSEPEFLATSLTAEIGKEVVKRKGSTPSKKIPGLIKDVQKQQDHMRKLWGKPRRPAHVFKPSKTVAKPWEMLPEAFESFYAEAVEALSSEGEFVFPHEQIVETALKLGKLVPDEVINRYPRLKDAFYIYTSDEQDNLMSSIESNLAEYSNEIKADTEDRRIPFTDTSLTPDRIELTEQFMPPPDPIEIDTTIQGLMTDIESQVLDMENLTPREKSIVREDALIEYPELAAEVEKPKVRHDPLRLKSELEQALPNVQQDIDDRTTWDEDRVTKVIEESSIENKKAKKITVDKIINTLTDTFVDDRGAAKRLLRKTGNPRAIAAKEALEARSGAVDQAELAIEEVLSVTTRDLNNRQYKKLNAIIHNMRLIELAVKEKRAVGQKGVTALEAKNNLDKMFKDNPKEFKMLKDRANRVWGTFERELQLLADEKIVTPESLQAMKDSGKVYSPRLLLDYIDGADRTYFNGKISVPDSGLQRLKDLPDGEEILGYIETDVEAMIKHVITRTRHRIANNNVDVALFNFASNSPGNGIVEIAAPRQKTPKGWQRFSAVVDGQTREFFMIDEAAQDFLKNDPVINGTVARTIELLSGVWILRPMAVGMNPAFAFWNIFRDGTHAWLAGEDKLWHSFAPIALYEMGQDYASTFKDVWKRRGIFKAALADTIGLKLLAHQSRPESITKGRDPVSALARGLNKVIGVSEYWGRTAAYKRAKDNGFTGKQAANIARNLLDHNQGGTLFKALNHGLPFIKSGSQATRSVVRATMDKPGLMAWKTAQLGLLAIALKGAWKYLAKKENGDSFTDDISIHDKRTKFNIFSGITFKGADGQERAVYFKLPKDEAVQPITTLFEQSWDVWVDGKPFDEETMVDSLVAAIPATPVELSSPTYDAAIGLAANFDTFRMKKIFNRTNGEIDPLHEVIPGKTPEAYVALARGIDKVPLLRELIPPSPVRLQYAMQQFFTRGNIWTTLAGYPIRKIFENLDDKSRNEIGKTLWEDLARTPILKRFIGITNPNNKIDNEKRLATQIENDRKWQLKVTAEELWSNRASTGGIKLWKEFFKGLNESEQKSVVRRIQRNEQLDTLDLRMGKAFWQRFIGTAPQIKAHMLLQEWSTSSPARKAAIQRDLDILSTKEAIKLGVVTERTAKEFDVLIKKQRGE
jgi:hypothetical protein